MIAVLIVTIALAVQEAPAAASQPPAIPAPDCAQLLASNPPPPLVQLCKADETLRKAALPAESQQERIQLWREAGELYARSAQLLLDPMHRMYAFDAIARLYDPAYLNDPAAVENALRQLAALMVETPAALLRLALFQEQHTGAEAAENTLLAARQHYTESSEVFDALSTFYARRATALTQRQDRGSRAPEAGAAPGAREEQRYRPNCQQYSFGNPGSGLAELCAAEAEMRKASAAPAGSLERSHLFRNAADLYERAAASFRTTPEKVFAHEAIARIYGSQNLNSPGDAEQALRQIIALSPGSIEPILRLARAQEEQKSIDAAEATLQAARQQHPDSAEVFKALAVFYSRLARPVSGGA